MHNHPAGGHEQALAGLEVEFDHGQTLQTQLLQRWLDSGEAIGGWKIGMTSGASRNAMGEGVRPFGFVLASRVIRSGSTLPLPALHRGQVENELCLRLAEPLGAGATAASARAAVAAVLPAFEINQKRLPAGASAGLRVADNLSNWGIVVGEPVEPIDNLDNLCVTLVGEAGDITGPIESVSSQGHIDNHYQSLATLANRLAEFGHQLNPGDHVITGAYGKTPFAAGRFAGEFDLGIGRVEINLQ